MTAPEFIYSVLLKPKLLRAAANATLRAMLPVSVRRHGATIHLNPEDPVVSGALALNVYEKPETEFFLSVCRPGMTFLDIGANVGYYSALALARFQGHGKVIALEPDPVSYTYLQRTVAANGQATCIPRAASDHFGSMRLFLNSDNKGDNRLYANDLASGSIEVAVVTVDGLLAELGVACADLIKVDVQGYEGHVFQGMAETIRRSPRLIIMTEFWPQGLRDAGTDPIGLLTGFEDLGVKLFELMPGGSLEPLTNKESLVSRFTGRRYTNIVAKKQ
jgi:FkbM family methyltransferase